VHDSVVTVRGKRIVHPLYRCINRRSTDGDSNHIGTFGLRYLQGIVEIGTDDPEPGVR
jgi:hypothetical protein